MIVVSACLLGCPTRYDGGANPHPLLAARAGCSPFLPVCPEQLGGLATPREPAELRGGDGAAALDGGCAVVAKDGADVTRQFLLGARRAAALARAHGARWVILKEGSPSCGVRRIHDGTFSGVRIAGAGVTAALLKMRGLEVVSDAALTPQLLREILQQ